MGSLMTHVPHGDIAGPPGHTHRGARRLHVPYAIDSKKAASGFANVQYEKLAAGKYVVAGEVRVNGKMEHAGFPSTTRLMASASWSKRLKISSSPSSWRRLRQTPSVRASGRRRSRTMAEVPSISATRDNKRRQS